MKYISILRGINVSGQKKIKMADLKILYEKQGFENVITYIQSGNVVFESNSEKNIEALRKIIEKAIKEEYLFYVPVDIRTNKELEQIIQKCPYQEAKEDDNGTKVLVTFLQSMPSEEKKELLFTYVKPPERLIIQGREAYLYCPNGYGKSKLSNTFIEKKICITSTTRNWKSVKKLYELSVEQQHV